MSKSSIWPMDTTLSGAATPGQSWQWSGTPHSRKTGALPSDCLVSYPEHSLGEGLTPPQRCSRCILKPQPTGWVTELDVLCVQWAKEELSDCVIIYFGGVHNTNLYILQSLYFCSHAFVITCSFSGGSFMSCKERTMNIEQRINLKFLVWLKESPL